MSFIKLVLLTENKKKYEQKCPYFFYCRGIFYRFFIVCFSGFEAAPYDMIGK